MKKILTLLALTALTFSVQAKVRLPHMICDNMVLQQQTEARLWGWAQPGKTIKVTTGCLITVFNFSGATFLASLR